MARRKVYRTFIGYEVNKFKGHEGEILEERLEDGEIREFFNAKIMVSQTPQEGYDDLILESDKGLLVEGQWYVKIVERIEEEEEAVTIFESKRLGERRGYMLRSMMAEQKQELKREAMTSELEKRLKRKQEIVKELLEKQKQ